MTDVVEMKSIELRVSLQQVDVGCDQSFSNCGNARIEIDPACTHAIEAPIRLGQIEIRIIEHRTSHAIDQNRLAAEITNHGSVSSRGERQHVDPGMHFEAASFCR